MHASTMICVARACRLLPLPFNIVRFMSSLWMHFDLGHAVVKLLSFYLYDLRNFCHMYGQQQKVPSNNSGITVKAQFNFRYTTPSLYMAHLLK